MPSNQTNLPMLNTPASEPKRFIIKDTRDWKTIDADGHGAVIVDASDDQSFLIIGSSQQCKMVLDALNGFYE